MIRYATQGGAKLKRYVLLYRGEGGQKSPKLALRNFWTAPKVGYHDVQRVFLVSIRKLPLLFVNFDIRASALHITNFLFR